MRFRPTWLAQLPLADWLFSRANVAQPVERRWGKQRLLDFVGAQPGAALGTLLESTTETEVHLLPQVVAHLQQPAYFIAGQEDSIMEPKYVHHLASFHPLFKARGENVIELPSCGHMAMIEKPEAIAHHLRRILHNHAD